MVLFLGTSLSRNFFTDLRKASVDMPKPRFASSNSQSANDFFLQFLFLKKLGEGTSIRRLKITLLIGLTCGADFFKPAFLALVRPSFTSLNPLVTFFRPLQPHSSIHNWGKYENSAGSTPTLPVIYRKCSLAKQAVHTESSRL